jgi:hypothetical protein
MPIFNFSIADAQPPVASDAVELVDVAAARCHALKYAGNILCDQKPRFWDEDE